MLEIGVAVTLVGLLFTVVAAATYLDALALPWYRNLVCAGATAGACEDWNLWVLVVAPLVLLTGGFYAGEQVRMRRRFRQLLDTNKKSEFLHNRRDLEDLARRLPKRFEERIEEKEGEFRSNR